MRRPLRKTSEPDALFSRDSLDRVTTADGAPPPTLVDGIFLKVCALIREGRLGAGARMPSVRQLALDCEISRDSAARAYDKLVAHGVLESRPSSGYFVKPGAQAREARLLAAPNATRAPRIAWDSLSAFHRMRFGLVQDSPSLRSRSGTGTLPADWIDEEKIGRALRSVARGAHRALVGHGDPQGFLPLREQLRLKLQTIGLNTDAANIIVTSGASDALSLIAQYYLQVPGDSVLVEQPGPPLLVDRLMSCGMGVEFVPRLSDGPDLEMLRKLCEKLRPRLFFCSSVLHNPTSAHLAPHKAFQLLRLAEEFDLILVEDDTYGDLLPGNLSTTVTRLAPLDQLKRVIYVGSFSKTLAPGLRVGFLAANLERIEWLSIYRLVNCIAGNSFAERAVYRLLSEGEYRHHCEQLRNRLAEIRPAVAREVRRAGLSLDSEPDAGMFLWADLGHNVDSYQVAQALLAEGHLLAPGAMFHLHASSRVRLNITTTLESGVLDALARFARPH